MSKFHIVYKIESEHYGVIFYHLITRPKNLLPLGRSSSPRKVMAEINNRYNNNKLVKEFVIRKIFDIEPVDIGSIDIPLG